MYFCGDRFFLGKDTYYKNLEALQPSTEYEFDEKGIIKKSSRYWEWKYNPRKVSLNQATEEFAQLFENICRDNLKNKKIILPLSGGLDSRTQAAVLGNADAVESYSYKFENSFNETKYGRKISEVKSFPFTEYVIPSGYLWKEIDTLSSINNCYADFTSPRQMAVMNQVSELGEVFFLGHWGDVLFDGMGVEDNLSTDEINKIIFKKIIKKSGTELAETLWESWGLAGNFKEYLEERIMDLMKEIKIENANAKIRAFKSMYWAPRWTSVNLEVFSKYKPVVLPYYDDELCKFICTIPESILSGRQIQINYIKMKNPKLAKIPWQDYYPYNLYDYNNFYKASALPMRALNKGKRIVQENLLGQKLILRNWEIQFRGEENEKKLKERLFQNGSMNELIEKEVVKKFYDKFKEEDGVKFSHSVNMLLVLSQFCRNNFNTEKSL